MRSETCGRDIERDNVNCNAVYCQYIRGTHSRTLFFIHRFRDQFKIDFSLGKICFGQLHTIFFIFNFLLEKRKARWKKFI